MTDEPAERPDALTAEERAARARRLAEVFGDVLPEQTSDDRDTRTSPPGTATPGAGPGAAAPRLS